MLVVEAVLLAAGLVVLLGHITWRRVRGAWLRPRVRAARDAVARTLAGDDACTALPWLPHAEAVRVLVDATRNVDVSARRELLAVPTNAALVTRASRWCGSGRWPRRLKGARLLTLLGAGADVVPSLLDDPRAEVRSEAAGWVGEHPTPERIARLVEMLDDKALSCRLVAQATLMQLKDRAVEPLRRHLVTPDPVALAPALLVAGRLGDPDLLGPAMAHASHPDPEVRAGVAKVLAAVGGDEAIEQLEGYLADADAMVRTTAVEGLGALRHWPSAPSLAQRLGDAAWSVRRAAGLALRRLEGPGRLYLQRALQADDRFAVDMARQVLDLPERVARQPVGR